MRWKLLAIVALLVATGAVIAASLGVFHDGTAAATSFLTATATTTDVTDEVTATGAVASTQTYDLAFGSDPITTAASSSSNANSSSNSNAASSSGAGSVSWPVSAVDVKIGDRVTKGQTLAKAATTDLEAQIANASRAAATTTLQLKQAQDGVDSASGTQATRQAKITLCNAETAKANADANLAGGASIEGTVESISGDTLTLKLTNGATVQVSLSDSTTYHAQAAASAGDVKTGGTVMVRIQLERGSGATSPSASDVTIVPSQAREPMRRRESDARPPRRG